MRDRFGIFGAVIRIRKLSLLLVVTLRMPNMYERESTYRGVAPLAESLSLPMPLSPFGLDL